MIKFSLHALNDKYAILGTTDRNVNLSNPARYEGPISKITSEDVAEQLVKDGLLKKLKQPKNLKPMPPSTDDAVGTKDSNA